MQVIFTTGKNICPPLTLNNVPIPVTTEVKYLGLHLDQCLTWHTHIQAKHRQLDTNFRQMHWLLGRNPKLSLSNKLLLYKVVLKPIWSYGVQLWGCTKPTRLNIIQRFQSKVLRSTVDAPWYVSITLLHNDLHIPSITDEIRQVATKYNKTHNHANHLYTSGQIEDFVDLAGRPRTTLKHYPIRRNHNGPIARKPRRTRPEDLILH